VPEANSERGDLAAWPDVGLGRRVGGRLLGAAWTTGTWRTLPDRRPKYAYIVTPLEQHEVNDGLVRFRTQSAHRLISAASAYLLLTSSYEAKE